MVILILLATILLSFILGVISKEKIRYLYPFSVAIMFIPSVFVYYNESALVHSLWYLIVSIVGLWVGIIIEILMKR